MIHTLNYSFDIMDIQLQDAVLLHRENIYIARQILRPPGIFFCVLRSKIIFVLRCIESLCTPNNYCSEEIHGKKITIRKDYYMVLKWAILIFH